MNTLCHLGFRQPTKTCPPPSNNDKLPINANKVEEAANRAKLTATHFASILIPNRPTLKKSTRFAFHNPTSTALHVKLPQQSAWAKRPYIAATIAAVAIGLTSYAAYKYLTPTTTPSDAPSPYTFHSFFGTAFKVSSYALCIPTLFIAPFRHLVVCRKPADNTALPANPLATPKSGRSLMMMGWHVIEDLAFGLKRSVCIYLKVIPASKYCFNFIIHKITM